MRTVSIFLRLFDLLMPRTCLVCGGRLSVGERVVCGPCNYQLPRTDCLSDLTANDMARRFWGRVPVERAFALVRHLPHALSAQTVYRLKYGRNPMLGNQMGWLLAHELAATDFFDGVDAIVPVPLARRRQRERGYNQSEQLARGIAEATGLPVITDAVRRVTFGGSQTQKDRHARLENVEHAFVPRRIERLRGLHVVLVDDVVTTGATLTACIRALMQAEGVRVSILAWGLAGK